MQVFTEYSSFLAYEGVIRQVTVMFSRTVVPLWSGSGIFICKALGLLAK